MTLDQINDGNPFTIASLAARGEIRKRLVDMGFIAGAQGIVMRRAPLGGPVVLRLGASRIALRLEEARQVQCAGSPSADA
jgi:ferrous iron transport protein A